MEMGGGWNWLSIVSNGVWTLVLAVLNLRALLSLCCLLQVSLLVSQLPSLRSETGFSTIIFREICC
jgi:hypothetical protein